METTGREADTSSLGIPQPVGEVEEEEGRREGRGEESLLKMIHLRMRSPS